MCANERSAVSLEKNIGYNESSNKFYSYSNLHIFACLQAYSEAFHMSYLLKLYMVKTNFPIFDPKTMTHQTLITFAHESNSVPTK